jgi:hypothetical protein
MIRVPTLGGFETRVVNGSAKPDLAFAGITIHPCEKYGSDERLQPAPRDHRRPAFYSVINQVSRPCRDFIRAAADFQRLASHAGNQGPVAFFLFLVVRAKASSD